jgi:hypothetical protein
MDRGTRLTIRDFVPGVTFHAVRLFRIRALGRLAAGRSYLAWRIIISISSASGERLTASSRLMILRAYRLYND